MFTHARRLFAEGQPVSPALHRPEVQTPFSHFSPGAHGGCVHPPQWSGSLDKWRHAPLHNVNPGRHSGLPA